MVGRINEGRDRMRIERTKIDTTVHSLCHNLETLCMNLDETRDRKLKNKILRSLEEWNESTGNFIEELRAESLIKEFDKRT